MASRFIRSLMAAAAVAGAMAAAGPATAAGIVMRYQFSNGQTITYNVTYTTTSRVVIGGKAQTVSVRETSQSHYAFSKVAADGSATLTLRSDHVVDQVTQNGKTTRRAGQSTVQSYLQRTDGEQLTGNLLADGAYSNGDFGALSTRAVSVGSTWTSMLTDRAAAMPCHNRLVAFVQDSGERAADIQTSCTATAPVQTTQQSELYRVSVTDTLTGHWHFGVLSGRFLWQDLHETVTSHGTVSDSKGTRAYSSAEQDTTIQKLLSDTASATATT